MRRVLAPVLVLLVLAPVLVLLVLAAVPAARADSLVFVEGSGAGVFGDLARTGVVATCLRDAGPGALSVQAPLGRHPRSSPTDLLTVPDLQRTAGADLGILDSCPEVASNGGVTVVAGVARGTAPGTAVIRAALREAGGDFGPPADLAQVDADGQFVVTVAVGPRGDAVVAWAQGASPFASDGTTTVLAARRPVGGQWAAPEVVLSERPARESYFGPIELHAGVDADGRTTLAAVVPAPSSESIYELGRMEVWTAAAGTAWAPPQVLGPGVYAGADASLAVAPNGRALIAAKGTGGVLTWQREPGAARFGTPVPVGEPFTDDPSETAVAVRDDGAAVLAYRFEDGSAERTVRGIAVARRVAGADFGAPERIWSLRGPGAYQSGGSVQGVTVGSGEVTAPPDTATVHVALTADGRIALAAGVPRVVRATGEETVAPLVATGTLDGALDARVLGSPCRSVNGAATTTLPDGAPVGAWTNNASLVVGVFDLPTGEGRVHVAPLVTAAVAQNAPHVRIVGPRRLQRIFGGEPLAVTVECDGPCDFRAAVPRDDRMPTAAAGGAIPRAGRTTIRLYPGLRPLAPLAAGAVPVTVQACSTDGTATAVVRGAVRAQRRPRLPLGGITRVVARHDGGDVVVSWRTRGPARRSIFAVSARPGNSPSDLADSTRYESVDGNGRTRFRIRFRDAAHIRLVSVAEYSIDQPFRVGHERTVRVTGR